MDLSEHFAMFLEQLAGQSPRNRELYTHRLRGFLQLHGRKQPDDITRSDVNQWLQVLINRGYAEATLSGYRQAVKSFFQYLLQEEEIDRSPAARPDVLRQRYRSRPVDLVVVFVP